jgi:hypothetical protein
METKTKYLYFDHWSRRKIANGTKTCIIRPRQLGEVGDRLAFEASVLRLTRVEHKPYSEALNHWASEGYCSRDEMKKRFKQRFHGTEPADDRSFYIHNFERIIENEQTGV